MKKLKQLLAVAVIIAAPFATAGVAAADSCAEGYTGPNSENLCVSVRTYTCTVNNENTVTIDQTNDQVAVSGDSGNGGNNNGGGAQSGSATNDNNVTFNVTVENGEVCTVVATVPATPETPETPPKEETPVTPTETAKPAVLASTASDSTPQLLLALGAVAAAIAGGLYVTARLAKR